MTTIRFASMFLLSAVCACADSPAPTPHPDIIVRPTTGASVEGTAFTCTSHPASVLTPCDVLDNMPQSGTGVSVGEDAVVELVLSRSSGIADGRVVAAAIDINYGGVPGGDAAPSATAEQRCSAGEAGVVDRQDPLDGWIEPVAVSTDVEGRNAGRFSLTFDWGTVSGTYDTGRLRPLPSR